MDPSNGVTQPIRQTHSARLSNVGLRCRVLRKMKSIVNCKLTLAWVGVLVEKSK